MKLLARNLTSHDQTEDSRSVGTERQAQDSRVLSERGKPRTLLNRNLRPILELEEFLYVLDLDVSRGDEV